MYTPMSVGILKHIIDNVDDSLELVIYDVNCDAYRKVYSVNTIYVSDAPWGTDHPDLPSVTEKGI